MGISLFQGWIKAFPNTKITLGEAGKIYVTVLIIRRGIFSKGGVKHFTGKFITKAMKN